MASKPTKPRDAAPVPRSGESWQSKDKRDGGLTVYIERVEDGWVTYKRFNRRAVRIENFVKLYHPFATEDV